MATPMDIRLLGPIEVVIESRPVDIGPTQARASLVALALSVGRSVSVERLIDTLWSDDPPLSPRKSIQKQVSTLRKNLGTSTIETTEGGYRLNVPEEAIDVQRFESLIESAFHMGDIRAGLEQLDQALGLWRGDPLGGVGTLDGFRGDRARLEELRLVAIERQAEIRLSLGEPAAMAGHLEDLVAQHPLREGLWALLMKALYRSGRQADALGAYQRLRSLLVEQLGVDPSVELQELELQILDHDPSLDRPERGLGRPAPTDVVAGAGAPPSNASFATTGELHGAERKVITVMLVGLGPMARQVTEDPEDLHELLTPYRDVIREAVERYGGEIDLQSGDAVRAIFGVVAHEDDPERALRAALRIQEAATRLKEEKPNASLDVGVTVDTGLALVDSTGEVDPPLVGDVLTTATRLQELVTPGEVIVGAGTHSATRRFTDFEELGQLPPEDGRSPLEAWKVLDVRSRTGADEPLSAVFVGRDLELAQLEEALARVIRDENPQLATITGDPGVGKTRLIQHFRIRLDGSPVPVAWRQGRCLPYGEGIALFALSGIVKAQAGILESDSGEEAKTKLDDAVGLLGVRDDEREWLISRLQPLVGIGKASPETAGRDELFRAWGRFVEALADRHPLIVVFEDIHWAEDVVLEFVEHLIDELVQVPLLVVCTARPELLEDHPTWGGGKRNATAIALPSLSAEDSTELLRELLSGMEVDAATRVSIQHRSGGNPLYLTEYARMALDDGHFRDVPDSLQALITARIDRLPEEEKMMLQTASVIGERFWLGAASHLHGLPPAPARELAKRLVRRRLIRPSRLSLVAGEEEFSFGHALVRDVAYGLLPRRSLRRMHQKASDWIEANAGERVADVAEILAYHGEQALALDAAAGDIDESLRQRTIEWLLAAGDRARHLDQEAAIGFFQRALDHIGEPSSGMGRALVSLGMTLADAWRLDEAEKTLREALDVYQGAEDVLGGVAARTELGKVLWLKGETDEAGEERDLAYRQALPNGPSQELAHAAVQRAAGRALAGDSQGAVAYLEEALPLSESHGSTEDRVRAYSMRGIARVDLGDQEGLQDLEDAVILAEASGLLSHAAIALNNLGHGLWRLEGTRRAIQPLERGMEIAEQRGVLSHAEWIRHTMIEILVDRGDWGWALEQAEGLVARERERTSSQMRATDIELARILFWRGDVDRADELRQRYVPFARTARDLQHLAPGLALAAAIACEVGEGDQARELIEEFYEVAADLPFYRASELPDLVRTSLVLGDLTIARRLAAREPESPAKARAGLITAQALLAEYEGELARAEDLFRESIERWDRFGHRLEQGLALFGAARVAQASGNDERAHLLASRARTRLQELEASTALGWLDRWGRSTA